MIDRRPQKVALARDGPRAGARARRRTSRRPASWEDLPGADVRRGLRRDAADREHLARRLPGRATRRSSTGSPSGWHGCRRAVLVMVTNPVDPLCTCGSRGRWATAGGCSATRSTTALRLRTAIAARRTCPRRRRRVGAGRARRRRRAGVQPRAVRGEPVALDAGARAAADDFVRSWYRRHVALDSGRSSTWTTGAGLARMVAAMRAERGEHVGGLGRCSTASTGCATSRSACRCTLGPRRGVTSGSSPRRAGGLQPRPDASARCRWIVAARGTRCARASPARPPPTDGA